MHFAAQYPANPCTGFLTKEGKVIMEWLLVLLMCIVVYYLWDLRSDPVLPATSNDWFVVANSNGVNAVTFYFYPVLAFSVCAGVCRPLTTSPYVTNPLFDRPNALIGDITLDKPEEYGAWFRHGIEYNRFGRPYGTHIASLVNSYRAASFRINPVNLPPEYLPHFLAHDSTAKSA
jgi:hypothetical protein